MSKRTKVIESNIQPNPKEAEIWAKVNKDGSREIKQYNSSTGKFECCGGSGSGSGESDFALYYQTELDSTNNLGVVSAAMDIHGFPCVMKAIVNTGSIYGTAQSFSSLSDVTSGIVQIQFIRVRAATSPAFEEYPFYTDDEIKSALGSLLNALTPITKEQFYNLEA